MFYSATCVVRCSIGSTIAQQAYDALWQHAMYDNISTDTERRAGLSAIAEPLISMYA